MRRPFWVSLAVAIFLAPAIAGCSATTTTESTGEYVDDSAITSKVKAALLGDSGLKSFKIGVQTYKNVVQLSGFVNSEELRTQAGHIAGGVAGVKSVKNDLVVK